MDYIKGGTLLSKKFWKTQAKIRKEKWVKGKENRLKLSEIRHLFSQLILGLSYIHNQYNVAHRDIKPDNILVNKDNTLHITDFGVSQSFKDSNDETTLKFGTVAYHPPEVYSDKPFSAKSTDIWAAGCILYQMYTGKLPYRGKDKLSWVKAIKEQEIKYPSEIEPNIKQILQGCLDRNYKTRLTVKQLLQNKWLFPDQSKKMDTLSVI